ncbi:hypothetical protein RINTHH_8180 [Richelia intracellularis HH01]|uniref:Uncharacterized protein n=1 Tax=Richelia intracellularis HH01 TaxID=1165094 RepID=M1WZN7_9NOST|nr:hypothetical protein RINTHH_8180 [Richelia intracellularis HH01]
MKPKKIPVATTPSNSCVQKLTQPTKLNILAIANLEYDWLSVLSVILITEIAVP